MPRQKGPYGPYKPRTAVNCTICRTTLQKPPGELNDSGVYVCPNPECRTAYSRRLGKTNFKTSRNLYVVQEVEGGRNFADIAAELGLTRERVRQIYRATKAHIQDGTVAVNRTPIRTATEATEVPPWAT